MTGPVEEMVWCQWEAAHVPVNHHCVGVNVSPMPCPDLTCGRCGRCLAAQAADLERRDQPPGQEAPDLREVRKRALAYIREQRVDVYLARPYGPDDRRPHVIRAVVRGYLHTYHVVGEHWPEGDRTHTWWCDCQPGMQQTVAVQCRHAASVALVTGWPCAAAPLAAEPDTAGGD
jgi:hypothetical protein